MVEKELSSRKRSAQDVDRSEENKSHEKVIEENERIICELRKKLNEREATIQSLTGKLEGNEGATAQFVAREKYDEVISVKEKKIASLSLLMNEKEKALEQALKKVNDLQVGYDQMKTQYAKTVDEKDKLSDQLQHLTATFLGPIESRQDLTNEEKRTLQDCVEFINLTSSVGASILVRNKAITRKMKAINNLMDARQNLYNSCELKK